jgi:hypothetical protein
VCGNRGILPSRGVESSQATSDVPGDFDHLVWSSTAIARKRMSSAFGYFRELASSSALTDNKTTLMNSASARKHSLEIHALGTFSDDTANDETRQVAGNV